MNALDLLITGLIEVVTKFLFDIGFKDAAQQIKQSNLEKQITKVVDQSIKNITIAGKKHNVEFNIYNRIHLQVVSPYIHEAMHMSGSFIAGVADAQPIFPDAEPYIQKLCEEDYE